MENEDCKIKVIDNGIIYPLSKGDNDQYDFNCEGGVVTPEGEFVTESQTVRNYCKKYWNIAPSITSNISTYNDYEVCYCGILTGHFGHFLLESISRLYYVIKNPEKFKCVFLIRPVCSLSLISEVFDILNIDKERIEIVTTPTQYKKVIVPESSVILYKEIKKEYMEIIDKMTLNVPFKTGMEKVFLSNKYYGRGIFRGNECQLEEIFNQNGYVSYYPNLLPLREQISIIKSAKEFVTTEGTSSHVALFLNSKAKCIILKRIPIDNVVQLEIDKIKGYNVEYVNSFISYFGMDSSISPTLLGLTDDLINYLNRNNMKYTPKNIDSKEFIEYICRLLNFVNGHKFIDINEESIKYLISCIYPYKDVSMLFMLKCLFYRYFNKRFGFFKSKKKYFDYDVLRTKIGFFTIKIDLKEKS